MIRFPVTVVCDNDKCPDEATAAVVVELFEGNRLPNVSLLYALIDNMELPPGWRKSAVDGAVYCSERCAETAR